MKKRKNKQGEKASESAKIENLKQKIINVKNAEGEADSTVEILIQNKINYVPKISVIVPVYNVESYLRQSLDYIINQTLREIEIICVDDGSTDSSLDILKEYAAKDKRISVLKQENLHAGVARNAGLAVAKGEYLSFLDSDDFFELNMLEMMYKEARKKQADIVICDADKFNDNESVYTHLDAIKPELIHKSVFCLEDIKLKPYFVTQPATWNKLYSADFIKKYSIRYQNLKSCNDFGFSYSVLSLADRICFLPEIFVHYRKSTKTSITSNRYRTAYNIIYAYLYVKDILRKYHKDFLIPSLNERFIAAIKYEGSLCNNDEILFFTQRAKQILKDEYQQFEKYFPLFKIPVVVAADNNYVKTLAVCLYSILEHTSSYIDFLVLEDGITSQNKEKIRASVSNFKNFDLSFIDMKKFNLSRFPKINRFTVSAFSRYFIPEICKRYDKVIYTDADVIFVGDIKEYYDIDMEGKGLAAVPEEMGKPRGGKYNHEYRKNLFKISPSHQYFANGNIILSCNYWRNNNITEKLIAKTIELSNQLVCPDLDIMNIIFQNNYKKLPFKFCAAVHRFTEINGNKEMIEGYKHPFIIHYSGMKKPWETSDVPYFREFDNIYKKTVFFQPDADVEGAHKAIVSVKPAQPKPTKYMLSYKFFKYIPFYTYKKRGGNQVWKIFGLPIWRVRKIADSVAVKYYLLGLPLFEIEEKGCKF